MAIECDVYNLLEKTYYTIFNMQEFSSLPEETSPQHYDVLHLISKRAHVQTCACTCHTVAQECRCVGANGFPVCAIVFTISSLGNPFVSGTGSGAASGRGT